MVFYSKGMIIMRKLYIVKTNQDFESIINNGICIKNKYYDNKARRISDRKNNFANFQQNTYDFEELEKKLLDN